MTTYMLDTCICSFIMCEHPKSVLQRLNAEATCNNRIVISAITYAEMRYGQIGKKASAKHKTLINDFVMRLDAIMPWDQYAVNLTVEIMQVLGKVGSLIGPNDTAIAGHAIAADCILVTNNTREFKRVPNLIYEDWV